MSIMELATDIILTAHFIMAYKHGYSEQFTAIMDIHIYPATDCTHFMTTTSSYKHCVCVVSPVSSKV